MKKKRIKQLEKNIKGIDSRHVPLMVLYGKWRQAVEDGDKPAAWGFREDANKCFYDEQGNFTKLAYFPPNDADISGIVKLVNWHRFVQFGFKQDSEKKRLRKPYEKRNSKNNL